MYLFDLHFEGVFSFDLQCRNFVKPTHTDIDEWHTQVLEIAIPLQWIIPSKVLTGGLNYFLCIILSLYGSSIMQVKPL